jgi:peptide-methionine (S)-S-oxide reductase
MIVFPSFVLMAVMKTKLYVVVVWCIAFASQSDAASRVIPAPLVDLSARQGLQTAVFAGGCFWGVELVFEHVRGVKNVTAGYSGGKDYMAHYKVVAGGDSGHAESVQILYDAQQVSYGELLRVFFSVAHDPTQLNRQGPDEGPQYRSTIFFANPDEERIARAYIQQLEAAKVFDEPIATTLEPNRGFFKAEAEHQDFATRNPRQLYVMLNDRPKLAHLQRLFPDLYDAKSPAN